MQSNQLYVQGDLTASVNATYIDGVLFYLTAIGRKLQRNLEKVPVSLILVWHAPFVAAKYSWFFAFPLEVSFYCYLTCFAIFGSSFFETALVVALLHRLVYCFVIPLRYTSHRFYKVLKRPCNVSTRRFNEL